MHSLRFSDIARILEVQPLQLYHDQVIESLLTDSRKLLLPEGSLFFAISGPQKDANAFIMPLYGNGVRSFITDKEMSSKDLANFPEGNFLRVTDVVEALQKIAAHRRHLFQIPVIGITGSNGKTIVKEWLYQLLNEHYNIIRSPKSFNSQVGVPLSVWNMNATHQLGIFEAGISMPGEMKNLQKLIDPSVGVFTYVGDAHASGFKNLQQKIDEKLQLFSNSDVLVYCADDEMLEHAVSDFRDKVNNKLQLFGWSRKNASSLYIKRIDIREQGSMVFCDYQSESFDFFIPFTDEASVHNAITCCCVLLYLEIPHASIAAHINQLKPVEMRLELKEGINNCSIINDSYSADLNSLSMALDFLTQQHQHSKHAVILSDVLQSGYDPDELYRKIAEVLNRKAIHRFVGIGPGIRSHAAAFEKIANRVFFDSTDEFLEHIAGMQFRDETILLKGARVFRFEKISHALEQKMHETVLEINLNALRDNLKLFKGMLKKEVKLMAMVKAFSYGSGSYEIAGLLQHASVDYLAVAYADEGVALRKSGIRLPIMVMNTEEAGFNNIIQYQLQPELYSFNILQAFEIFLKQHQVEHFPVHIKLDTGMNRLGFLPADMEELCKRLSKSTVFRVVSAFSHLAASDEETHDEFTHGQSDLFSTMTQNLEKALGYPVIKHIANSSAIHRHPEMQFDMVRLGIGLYGVDDKLKLQNVTTLKTTISQVKKVSKGSSVGYSRKGKVDRDSLIAVVRIGYADGYPRSLGNGAGKMLIHDRLVPVIGNVCMDMTMLDITGLEAAEGEEVIVFGEKLPVKTIAKWANTIPYEILTNISQRVKRVYFEE